MSAAVTRANSQSIRFPPARRGGETPRRGFRAETPQTLSPARRGGYTPRHGHVGKLREGGRRLWDQKLPEPDYFLVEFVEIGGERKSHTDNSGAVISVSLDGLIEGWNKAVPELPDLVEYVGVRG